MHALLYAQARHEAADARRQVPLSFVFFIYRCPSSSLLLSSPELNDAKVYEPQMRALLGTASQCCTVVVLESSTAAQCIQGYLAHEKSPLPRPLQQAYAEGPMVSITA